MGFVYIMRGIPGSGKSTVAREIARSWQIEEFPVAIHSTDDLCMVDGEYRFDAELAPQRHAQNLENFKASLEQGIPCVICDNTNVRQAFFQPYVDAAREHDYNVVFVELPHPSLDEAVERNTHGVPREVIDKMLLDWEPTQSCITVASVFFAADAIRRMEEKLGGTALLSFVGGTLFGALVVALAWFFHG